MRGARWGGGHKSWNTVVEENEKVKAEGRRKKRCGELQTSKREGCMKVGGGRLGWEMKATRTASRGVFVAVPGSSASEVFVQIV